MTDPRPTFPFRNPFRNPFREGGPAPGFWPAAACVKPTFALLAGPAADPPLGWLAFRGFFATAALALEQAERFRGPGVWWQVVDLVAGSVVASSAEGGSPPCE